MASLTEKYSAAASSDPQSTAEVHAKVLQYQPDWSSYPTTKDYKAQLDIFKSDVAATHKTAMLYGQPGVVKACLAALSLSDVEPVQWTITVLHDIIREDNNCFGLFEDYFKGQSQFLEVMLGVLGRQQLDEYTIDKAAWVLTAVVGNIPGSFSDACVKSILEKVQGTKCSNLGILEATVNLLKADRFRKFVWQSPGVEERVMSIDPQTTAPPFLYKSIFALWMLSFEPEGSLSLDEEVVIKKIKDILVVSRVEKVVRLSLTVLRNIIGHKKFAEQVVELGVLDAVQQLEFEKWRDAELYDDIRDIASVISAQIQEMSNFDRYERELNDGKLKWGFIHSTKFWAENVLKFEQNDFRALKALALCLQGPDTTTQAVACHDLGEFVTMHPLGKKQIAKLGVKEEVMRLMSSVDPTMKEVRREALLCCQKIMLNKWQDLEA